MAERTLRIGTRGSPLALWQAHWAREALQAAHPECRLEPIEMRTRAEKFPEREIAEIGVGIFTREIDDALLRRDIDIAVHSLKDVPSEIPGDLALAAIPERESPLDAFLSRDGSTRFDDLPPGARVGTGSPRRRAQLLARRPDLEMVSLRGNVATRVAKMEAQDLHGIVLAHAGLRRLGEESRITHLLAPEVVVPAVGQGALGVMARRDDPEVLELLRALEHAPSRVLVEAERSFLRRLRGGCLVPAGALATSEDGEQLVIRAAIAAPDGSLLVRSEVAGTVAESEDLGRRLADEVLSRGGAEILQRLGRGA